ncbi:MAG: hypothetical protein JO011_05610 [Ktedonobacteraceae bacterium]|nr:hypothetical protein [Ktedonobacteraceae bacterium]
MRCRDWGKDGIHLPAVWWMGNCVNAFAAVPGLTPLCRMLLHISLAPSRCLRSHYPPSRAGFAEGRRAGIRRRTAERLCLMRDTREMEARMGTSVSLFEQESGWS